LKAIQIDRYGGPEVLIRRDIPVPAPAPDEVLIRLAHSGINFMDVHTRQGKYAGSRTYTVSVPTTLGIEGAGTIEAVGRDVTDLKPGDRVAYCLHWGSYAEYAAVPAWRVVPVPDAMPLDRAAASMFHGLTAHYLAHDVGRLGPGVTCLVHSASGGIGQLLVQLGARMGATVIATTSTPAKAEVARQRGAAHALLYEDGRFADAVLDLTGGRGVDVVFDPIGRPTLRDSFRATRKRGLVVNFGAVGGPVRDLDPIELGEAGSLFLTRPRLADHLPDGPTIRRRAADIFSGLLDGALSLDIAARFTLDNVEEAHAALEERRLIGKPLLDLPQVDLPPR
jgi:NADPH2:quinone reductase